MDEMPDTKTSVAVIGALLVLLMVLHSSLLDAQFTNVRVSDPLSTSPEEVTIAVNPTDSNNLIAGANLRFYFYSTNGGTSWTQRQLPPGTYGDPCIVFDVNGRAYYGHLSDMRSRGGYWLDRIVVHRSSDGGTTWFDSLVTPVNSPKHQDKEWLTCDMTNSPFRNTLYMAWTEFDTYGSLDPADSTRIVLSRLTNGSNGWTSPIRISDEGGNCLDDDSTVEGAVPAVGPNGEVYVAWAGPRGIEFDRSFDGGVTWGKDIRVTDMPGGWAHMIPGIYRCNGLPTTVCDASNAATRGYVYILWADQRNGTANTDVFMVRSTDRGSTWGPVRRVNTDVGQTQQFFPWIAIDQSSGVLYVTFYDRRDYPTAETTTDVYLAKSTDGGNTWRDFRISQVPFTPDPAIFFGDYLSIVAAHGRIYPIWMKLDNSKLSVWTASITEQSTQEYEAPEGSPSESWLEDNYPDPVNPSTKIEFHLGSSGHASLKVYDVIGRHITTLVDASLRAGRHAAMFYVDDLPSGAYFYTLQSGEYAETKKMIIAR